MTWLCGHVTHDLKFAEGDPLSKLFLWVTSVKASILANETVWHGLQLMSARAEKP